jgi:tripartite-type tricarboxylate transporter receptor subunit TctC
VGAQSPYKSFDQLLAAFKAQPGVLKVGTAGRTSSGSVAMQLLHHATGIQFTTVAFNGGAEAAAALAAWQVDVMAQTFSDASALMLSGQIVPLATLSSEPLVVQGLPAPIPPVSQWVPGLSANGNYFGFYLPKGTPANELRTVQRIWDEVIPNSVEIKDYSLREGAVFSPVSGAAAQVEALKYLSKAAWSLYETRQLLISPEAAGIPKP